MAKVYGDTSGLKPNQRKRLENLYRRRLPMDQLILAEQARDLSRLAAEAGRQVGLVVSRQGEVVQVVAGGPSAIPEPDPDRLRRGRSRLAGYWLLHTAPEGAGVGGQDLSWLSRRRWDLVAVLEVAEDGLPAGISVAHLLPAPIDGADYGLVGPFTPGRPPEDFGALVASLEEELERRAAAQDVADGQGAVLVSVSPAPRETAEESLDELAELARSAGLKVLDRVIQRRPQVDPRTILGSGKLDQVLLSALRAGASWLVFDQELSPSQAHNLALYTDSGLKFIDRTQLILDIFAQRATTREGKLQVEMAQLRYLGPRLSQRDDGLSRLTGGIGGRGPGETRLEIDRRRLRERLHRLSKDLKNVARQRQRRRQRRSQVGLPIVSIVGYTNAGKSTLLNALTGSEVLAENRLFATLDPTTRRLRFPQEREVIITDTVGFIRDLPDDLRRAFAATLEELDAADLLLHVADAANPAVEEHIDRVNRLLDEMDLGRVPRIMVFNKMDLAQPALLEGLIRRHGGVAISARDRESLHPLLEMIEDRLFRLAPEAGPDKLDGANPAGGLPDDNPSQWLGD